MCTYRKMKKNYKWQEMKRAFRLYIKEMGEWTDSSIKMCNKNFKSLLEDSFKSSITFRHLSKRFITTYFMV